MSRRLSVGFAVVMASIVFIALAAASRTLPEDLHGYLEWTRATSQKSFIESAHPVAKDVYFNATAAETLASMAFPYGEGSVIVKEVTDPDSLVVTVITAMRKVGGFFPEGGDWQYGMFERTEDGSGYMGEWMSVENAAMCIGCHQAAADNDYTFINYLD